MRRAAVLIVFLAFFLIGCGQHIRVKEMAPLPLKHTYALVIATSYPPQETTKAVVQTMKGVMEFEDQVFTPFLASPLQLKGKPESLKDLGDALLLIKKVIYKPPPQAKLTLEMEFFEFATGRNAPRSITVSCTCPQMGKREALELLSKEAIRHILQEIEAPDDAVLSKGFSGLGDGGAEGAETR